MYNSNGNLISEVGIDMSDHVIGAGTMSTFLPFSPSRKLFEHVPNASDIEQSGIGNCALLAALQSIAELNPIFINRMMRDVGNGQVAVRLYQKIVEPDPNEPSNTLTTFEPCYIRISKTFLRAFYKPTHRHHAMWVHMIEKAYAAMQMHINRRQIRPPGSDVARFAHNIQEALNGGHSDYCFETILGQTSEIHLIFGERYLNPETLGRLPHDYSHPANILYNAITCKSAHQASEENINQVLTRIFPDDPQRQIFRDATTAAIGENFHAMFIKDKKLPSYYKIFRREKLHEFAQANYQQLPPEVFEAFNNYIKLNFPEKRGSAYYIHNQDEAYFRIFDALRRNRLICLGTDTQVGYEPRLFRKPEQEKVKGLVALHAYSVFNCYERAGRKFLLLRNPWARYTREYISLEDALRARASRGVPQLAYADYVCQNFARPVTRERLLQLLNTDGVFELEISDLTKRFRNIYIGQFPSAQ
tara:strand:+ start:2518 stop:3939 length:1422 start_codon:yes stop_codon:yes gene_type:complete